MQAQAEDELKKQREHEAKKISSRNATNAESAQNEIVTAEQSEKAEKSETQTANAKQHAEQAELAQLKVRETNAQNEQTAQEEMRRKTKEIKTAEYTTKEVQADREATEATSHQKISQAKELDAEVKLVRGDHERATATRESKAKDEANSEDKLSASRKDHDETEAAVQLENEALAEFTKRIDEKKAATHKAEEEERTQTGARLSAEIASKKAFLRGKQEEYKAVCASMDADREHEASLRVKTRKLLKEDSAARKDALKDELASAEEEDKRADQLLSEREAQLRTNDKTIHAKEKQNDSQRSQFKETEEKEVELAKQKVESDYLVEQDEIKKLALDTAAMREREVAVKAEREKAMEANTAHDEEIEALEGQIAVYKEMCAEQGVALSSDDENAGA